MNSTEPIAVTTGYYGGQATVKALDESLVLPVGLALYPQPAQQRGAAGLIGALEDAQRAINSMKVEAETAAQGDERMMLEACETISNEGLQACMAISAALASHGQAPAQPEVVPECHYGPLRDADAEWGKQLSVYATLPRAADTQQTPAQAAPAAVAGPSGYGPKVTVKRRCSDCKACNSESYAVQGDSGHYVYCEHPSLPESKYIGNTNWDTPDWCPAAAPTTQPTPKQEAQEPVAVIGAGFTTGHGPIAQIVERHALKVGTQLYTAPQPSPAVQGDAARLERERICAAIKAEDDYCIDQGDYMLDSDDCIKIARGEWVRPEYQVGAARAAQEGKSHDN